jgi:hemerythrin-like domain-containing protein
MKSTVSIEPPSSLAVSEAKLLHRVQRVATTLLVDAAQRDTAPSSALAQLRAFLVTALLHYHQSEDDFLWPQLIAADPAAGTGLIELSAEHDALEAAVSTLGAVPLQTGRDRARLAAAAEAVRNLLHKHLEHEESLLLPALETHVSDEAWMTFSRSMIASMPPSCASLSLGFLEQVGTPAEFRMVTANLSRSALQLIPSMREQGLSILNSLR